ncbi:MAG: CDP-glucose 4,6-dehydratase [Brevinema sp.]
MATLELLKKAYQGKRVLVTGHTGFKGTWMVRLLLQLGAKVYGIGLDEGDNKVFTLSNTASDMESHILDIRDSTSTINLIQKINPHLVFHLAAQPLVIESYKNPIATFDTNVMGTVNVLEGCRKATSLEGAVMITTDKVYHNFEWAYPYRETDILGGHDPYSTSKAACELVISSYRSSFFEHKKICSLRAGNVIGGGDFADNRIIPDLVRGVQKGEKAQIRAPHSIRPWQHVLDALWGYLLAGEQLATNGMTPSPSYNIAPPDNNDSHTVLFVIKNFLSVLGKGEYEVDENAAVFKEMGRLRLDPSLIMQELDWKPGFTTEEAIAQTASEYKAWLENPSQLKQQIDQSIALYVKNQGK